MKTMLVRYPDTEPLRRLMGQGEEFLNNETFVEYKYNGANTSTQLEEIEGRMVPVNYTHNQQADPAVDVQIKSCSSWSGIVNLLYDEYLNHQRIIVVYGELMTSTESNKSLGLGLKNGQWERVVFDMFDRTSGAFLSYDEMSSLAARYGIAQTSLLERLVPKTVEDVAAIATRWEPWVKEHDAEGVVIKTYGPSLDKGFAHFKWRQDKPLPEKQLKPHGPVLPAMPPEKILRALQHTWDALAVKLLEGDNPPNADVIDEKILPLWQNRGLTMPLIAKYLLQESQEHGYAVPRNAYQIYLDADLNAVRGK